MNKIRTFTLLSVITLGAAFSATVRAADNIWDKVTKVTVNEPIEVPGAVLQPGIYTFQLVDSPSERHTVQILSENGRHVFTTFIAINAERMEPTGKTVFTFYETPAGQPRAVKLWFYPGDSFGQEFVYKKGRAVELSQVSHQEVRTEEAQNTPPPAPAPVAEAAPAPAPAPPAPEIAQNEPPAAAAPEPAPVEPPAPAVLPQTASNIPFLTLLGLLSLSAALGVSVLAKKVG